MMQHRLISSLFIIASLMIVSGLQIKELSRLRGFDGSKNAVRNELNTETISAQLELLKHLPAFGFSNIVADGVFLQFLQYFGDDIARQQTGYQLSPKFFEVITAHEPYFIESYVFLSASTTLYAGLPEQSVEVMTRGLEYLAPNRPPRAYFVWRYKGIDELLFLGDAAAAQQSFATAAEWAEDSIDPESQTAAELSRSMAEFLSKKPESKYAQLNAWFSVFSNALDESTRNLAIKQIEALGGSIDTKPDGNVTINYPPKD
ncbi:MAG: hypothetical protein AAFW84_20390 [Cyanobacteria bacterium J06635_15]